LNKYFLNINAKIMEYYFSKSLHDSFENCISKVTEALISEGFGIITEIDMQAKLKEKLGVNFKKYRILGACNPPLAYKALQAEDKIGTMLPCNILVIEQGENQIEIAAVNPIASMMAVQNSALEPLANEITEKLKRVINQLK
jgi:uncharacterized protein (DUF302 family)